LQLRVALARACQTFAPYSRAAVRASLRAQHEGRPARYHCDSPLRNGLCGRMSRVRRPSVCGGDCGFFSQPAPPHIRKFAGLAKAQRLKRGKGASLRRPTGVGTDLGGSLLTRLVLDPVGRGSARHKAKMYTALACVCDAFLSPCPGKSGFALPTRAAVSCRATPPVRSALS
jgi:hypothetical protein